MGRPTVLALLAVTLFFLAFPLTVGKPGMPPNLKADEPAYYLMALSLAHDRDLAAEPRDFARAFREFPYMPVRNVVLMTDDGWRHVYFGKPYLYSLLAAPFARLAGANGMVFFNMLLMMGMVWLGAVYLARRAPGWLAALFAAGFFVLSAGFAYVFWLQPEVLNMAAVAACLFCGLSAADAGRVPAGEGAPPGRWRRLGGAALPFLSGAALAVGVYNKPMVAALGLPVLYALARRRRWRALGAWLAGSAIVLGAAAGGAVALTGHPSAYLGVTRQGFTLCGPDEGPVFPKAPAAEVPAKVPPAPAAPAETAAPQAPTSAASGETEADAGAEQESPFGSWLWIFRVPEIHLDELLENVGYFLWGRHTGLLLYFPFSLLAVVLFLLHGRRDGRGWVLLGALAAVALFFLVFVPYNWQGGGGFIGNRYYVAVYPGFLFLVAGLAPRALTVLWHALGGLLLGPLLLTPYGVPVPAATLQAHTRNFPLRLFPLELSLKNVPGYETLDQSGAWILARRDLMLQIGQEMWLLGGTPVEVLLSTSEPIERAVFRVRDLAPGNAVELAMGRARERIGFAAAAVSGAAGGERRVELLPGRPDRVRSQQGQRVYVYRLTVSTETGRFTTWRRYSPPERCSSFPWVESAEESFFLGAALTYLGDGKALAADLYALEWGQCELPERVTAGETFTVATRLFNRSAVTWPASGPASGPAVVNLSYHWRDAAGAEVVRDGLRTALPRPVQPGERVAVEQRIEAPAEPGRYTLELDPVFELVAWFSDKNGGNTLRQAIEVVPARP